MTAAYHGRMSEHEEQRAVCEYLDLLDIPYYHVPNEGLRSASAGAKLKSVGLSPGVPDLCIPVARGGYHSLYIEMKAEGGKPTEAQARWIWRLREEGMCAWVCYGAENAIPLIDRYLSEQL